MENEWEDARILVTGATGFLGSATIQELLRLLPASVTLTCVVRDASRLPISSRIIPVVSDICAIESYSKHLLEANFILWIAANRDHSATLEQLDSVNVRTVRMALEVLEESASLRRFLYVSSISAVDNPQGDTSPLTDIAIPHPQTKYGQSKLRAEEEVKGSGIPWTILRLPFLYGPGFTAASFLAWYRIVSRNRFLRSLPYPAHLSLLYTGDFASIVIAVLGRDGQLAADQSPYFVSDGNQYRVADLLNVVYRVKGDPRGGGHTRRWPSRFRDVISALRSFAYWQHALFSKYFFCVDSARFHKSFPLISYRAVEEGLIKSYQSPSKGLPD